MPRPRTTLRMAAFSARNWHFFNHPGQPTPRDGDRLIARAKKIARKFGLGLPCGSAREGARSRSEVFVMRNVILAVAGTVLMSCGAYGQNAASGTHSCEDLAHLELLGATILSAQTVP